VVGAFDRFNYGDVLFPVILDEVLRRYQCPWPRSFHATRQSDLTGHGGKRTRPLRALFQELQLPPESVVIVAGGEVLDADWTGTLENVLSGPMSIFLGQLRDRCGRTCANHIARLLSGTRLECPWILSPDDFDAPVRVAYNAVGGSSLGKLPAPVRARIEEKLARAAYLSVRDRQIQQQLEASQSRLFAHLAPDSAVLMSLFYPRECLASLARGVGGLLDPVREGYLCFQINKSLGSSQAPLIAQELERVHRRLGLGVLFLPNGRARNHEDQVALAQIHALMHTPAVFANGELGIFDIMSLIAGSTVYAGTSLHGNLSALSFGVPHVGLTQQVPKLEAFLQTWDLPKQRECVSIQGLTQRIKEVLRISTAERERKRSELVEASLRNFEAMFKATGIPGNFELSDSIFAGGSGLNLELAAVQ